MRLLAVVSAMFMSVSAFANPTVIEVDVGTEDLQGRLWSSVCVANTELESAVELKWTYEVGDDVEMQSVTVEPNQIVLFRAAFPDGGRPMALNLAFDSNLDPEGEEMISMAVDGDITYWRPTRCMLPRNMKFAGQDGRDGFIDLIDVE